MPSPSPRSLPIPVSAFSPPPLRAPSMNGALPPIVQEGNAAVRRRRICVLGSRQVGKSALVVQYVEHHFLSKYYPTIESTFHASLAHRSQPYTLEIVDTAGQDEYSVLASRYAIGVHGFVLVYSVASRPSFEMIRGLHDKIMQYYGVRGEVPCVIVGQKQDLVEKQLATRQITPQEGQALAKSIHAAWIETSASSNLNIDKVFDLLLEEVERQYSPTPDRPQPGRCWIM
ncbi:ras-domain-containing protein [Calocera viscosa TUFC12733]|uniref:Ras-domain-containing protein n=1 Tax=Calocera viscosa (strain TUFC12733) TaxID=1330018 RepID=A0A167H8S6_CALVF|nr:ras-domain-containing protein [Calocera viscosa TUFC12733]